MMSFCELCMVLIILIETGFTFQGQEIYSGLWNEYFNMHWNIVELQTKKN